jgi:hypothetical protein
MYTAQEVIKDKFWIVKNSDGKVGTLRFLSTDKYEFFDQRSHDTSIISSIEEMFKLTLVAREDSVNGNSLVNGYPCGYDAPIPVEHDLPLFKKSETSKTLMAAGYYIIQFKKWLPSFCPKYDTLQKNTFRGPYQTEWEMNLELKKAKR